MPVTLKQIRAADWQPCYTYQGSSISFITFSCAIPHLTVTHEKRAAGVGPTACQPRTRIYYTARGRRTDSPSQAVRIWNEEERKCQVAAEALLRATAAPAARESALSAAPPAGRAGR